MAKVFYCSACGRALEVKIGAVKGHGTVRVVAPHECGELVDDAGLAEVLSKDQNAAPAEGEFVSKLNDLSPEPDPRTPGWSEDERPQDLEPGDRRSAEHVKEGATTTAPSALQDMMDNISPTTPANNIGDEPGDGSES